MQCSDQGRVCEALVLHIATEEASYQLAILER